MSQVKLTALIILIISSTIFSNEIKSHAEASIFVPKEDLTKEAAELLKDPETRTKWNNFKKYVYPDDSYKIIFFPPPLNNQKSNFDFSDTNTWGKVAFDFAFSKQISGHERTIFYFNKTAPFPFLHIKLPAFDDFSYKGTELNPGMFLTYPFQLAQMTYGKLYPEELGGKWPVYIIGPAKEILVISAEIPDINNSGENNSNNILVRSGQIMLGTEQGKEMAKYLRGNIIPTKAYFRSESDAQSWHQSGNEHMKVDYEIKDWSYPTNAGNLCKESLGFLVENMKLIKEKIDSLE